MDAKRPQRDAKPMQKTNKKKGSIAPTQFQRMQSKFPKFAELRIFEMVCTNGAHDKVILDAWQTHARTYSRTILGCCCNLWRVRSAAFGRPTNSAQVKSCNLIRDFPKFQLK